MPDSEQMGQFNLPMGKNMYKVLLLAGEFINFEKVLSGPGVMWFELGFERGWSWKDSGVLDYRERQT